MNERVTQYGVVTPDILKSYDGLGFPKAIIAGTLPQPPISETARLSPGRGRVWPRGVRGPAGVPPLQSDRHGAWRLSPPRCSIPRSACAIFSTLAKGDTWTTLELKVNFVRPLSKDTGPVRAEGRIMHRGRTVATSEGDLKDRAGKLYAHATTTCMIFPAKT